MTTRQEAPSTTRKEITSITPLMWTLIAALLTLVAPVLFELLPPHLRHVPIWLTGAAAVSWVFWAESQVRAIASVRLRRCGVSALIAIIIGACMLGSSRVPAAPFVPHGGLEVALLRPSGERARLKRNSIPVLPHASNERALSEPRLDAARLTPGNKPSPTPTSSDASDENVRFFLGSCVATAKRFPYVVLAQREKAAGEVEHLIVVDRDEQGILVSATLFASDGQVLCQIDRNELHPNFDKVFRVVRDEHNRLTVLDKQGNAKLDVEFLNPSAVRVNGEFFARRGVPVVINDDQTTINTVRLERVEIRQLSYVIPE